MAAGRRCVLVDARVNGLPGAHGIARSVLKLTAHMPEWNDGLDVRVLVNPARTQLFPLAELAARADVVETPITLGAVHRCRELARLIRSVGASVLYVPYPTFTPFIRPCPIVVTIHDCTIESDLDFAGGWLRQAGLKLATSLVLRRAAATTAPTRASLAQIGQHYPRAPHPTLVPNGVDVRQFADVTAAEVAAARSRYRLPARFILTVGAHRPHKNHELLVRALAAMPGHVSLVIAGVPDASFHDPLPGLISDLGLRERVRLVPEVADEWLPAVYRAASVFAFPSLAEGYGMPVLEAMAAGVPVVASPIPALTEVARSAAVMVPPHDVAGWTKALASVLADRRTSASLSAAGSAVAAATSWERGASALRGLLSLVARGIPIQASAARREPAAHQALSL
jgi:glycosyltransferase involved in cell wall biosynthesis